MDGTQSEQSGSTPASTSSFGASSHGVQPTTDRDFMSQLDHLALETIIEMKISRFLEQIGSFYPENLHSMIMKKAEKPLLGQILRRTGGNQVHAARILGINRNTLRKKMKMYGFS